MNWVIFRFSTRTLPLCLWKNKSSSHKYPHTSQPQRSDRISAQWTLATKQEGKHENGQVTRDEGSEKATLLASLSGLCSSSPSICV